MTRTSRAARPDTTANAGHDRDGSERDASVADREAVRPGSGAAWVRGRLSRWGARLGNWNDQQAPFGGPYPPWWRAIDRIAGWLYVLPERTR